MVSEHSLTSTEARLAMTAELLVPQSTVKTQHFHRPGVEPCRMHRTAYATPPRNRVTLRDSGSPIPTARSMPRLVMASMQSVTVRLRGLGSNSGIDTSLATLDSVKMNNTK